MFTASVQENVMVIALQLEEWIKMGSVDGTLTSEWCVIVAAKLSTVNPYCSFGFKKGWLQRHNSRKKAVVWFRAKAYCTFSTCTVHCDLHVTKDDDGGDVKLRVLQRGDVLHRGEERKARRIKGVERTKMQNELLHCSPSSLYNESMQKLPLEMLASGNRDGIGRTKAVLQKISSEARKMEQRHENLIESLLMLRDEFSTRTASNRFPGYIRRIHCSPFTVMCFTEIGVRIYHHMIKKSTLYCNATGNLVTLRGVQTLQPAGVILYYSLVVQHPKGDSPVAVAEMITAEHNITAVSHFLECFRREETTIFGWKNMSTPAKIVIDRSLVLLNSFLRVYNFESLSQYLHRCFRVVSGCGEEGDYHQVFVLACISHVMNSAKHLCRRLL